MKESKLLGALLPSSPDFQPIIEAIREKYGLPEISYDDDPIQEIYLGNAIISFEEFRQDIENHLRINLDFMPPETKKIYLSAKMLTAVTEFKELEELSDALRTAMQMFIQFAKNMMKPIAQLLDVQVDHVVNMLYIFLLTGETEEVPNDWFGKVSTMTMSGEPMVIAMASEITNIDVFIQQIRAEHKKTFGVRDHKVTETAVSTAYYLRLKRAKKSWDFIFEEYIRRNKVSLPRNINSQRYIDVRRLHEQRLKKRMQRTEAILDVIIKDKK